MTVFSPEQLDQLAAEVDRQLKEIRLIQPKGLTRSGETERSLLEQSALQKQREAIDKYAQEPADGFLRRFMRTGRRDLCQEDGALYKQWKKWGDLENKEALERIGMLLAGMGLSGDVVSPLAVAVTVLVLHLSVRTICEEYGGASNPE